MDRRIEISAACCILWALLLLVLPPGLLLAAAVAAAVHEFFHAAAVRLFSGRILALRIGAGGMVMETTPLLPWQTVVCTLAGPAGSFLLLATVRWWPWLALCGFIHGCFNLLPLDPLDGGRVLGCLLEMWGMEWMQKWIEGAVLLLLFLLAVWLRMGLSPIAVWCVLAMRKIPCKDARFGVQ